jgi:hypothetical protein
MFSNVILFPASCFVQLPQALLSTNSVSVIIWWCQMKRENDHKLQRRIYKQPVKGVDFLILPGLFNPLRPSGKYMNHLLWQSVMMHFVFIGLAWFSLQTAIISLNSVNQLIFVMVKCGVLFEVRTGFLNII